MQNVLQVQCLAGRMVYFGKAPYAVFGAHTIQLNSALMHIQVKGER
jgi:hypothetical protein